MTEEHREAQVAKGQALLRTLATAKANARVFPLNHPSVLEPLGELVSLLSEIFSHGKSAGLDIVNRELYFDDVALKEESLTYEEFINECLERKVGSIKFLASVTSEDIGMFLSVLNSKAEELDLDAGWEEIMGQQNIKNISVEEISPLGNEQEDSDQPPEEESPRQTYFSAVDCMRDVAEGVKKGLKLNPKRIKRVVESLASQLSTNEHVLLGLANMKSYHEYTFYHSVNVAILSILTGARAELDKDALNALGISALLHDVGKIRMPVEILDKPGSLTEEEWHMMRRHPVEGAEILMDFDSDDNMAMTVALEHHAGYNLQGYPKLTARKELHIFSRIAAIADVYDALSTNRSYRSAMLLTRAIKMIMRDSGTQLDPLLVKVFLNLTGIFPVGSLVVLNTSEMAIVYENNSDSPLLPKVIIIRDAQGEDIDHSIVDLTEYNRIAKGNARVIAKSVDPYVHGVDVTRYF